ncbi:YfkD famly protein [Lederbergia citrea]|uniref:YfkD family protein n=1 Tax=Lederbergia citrea TaxID=2833581 RepID=A0A942UTY0_9BACI|nr:YfkD famly protein [Lederbergia citrea]MBS4179210.1 YfkD family protein [Lederbergia citrea]MBS4205873.1 YfkD family protein [Lederbergia citrea]MBS4224678.1 YfkD family protein [Lederbergia citrea]
MNRHRIVLNVCIILALALGASSTALAEKQGQAVNTKKITLPSSVVNIEKENTFPHSNVNLPSLQPSEFTKELLETSKVRIDNPNLIKMLNESAINKSPLSIGVRATIYLGEWPLNYESDLTEPNWQYQKVNSNVYDNRGGIANYQINYVQEMQKTVKGGLTDKVPQAEDVQKMLLLKAIEKTKLPLSFESVIGAGSKHHHIYNVPPKRLGYLHAYAPAIHEKGKVTYGEVYIVIKGTKRRIVVKNVTSHPIGAWMPIRNHLSFGFQGSN